MPGFIIKNVDGNPAVVTDVTLINALFCYQYTNIIPTDFYQYSDAVSELYKLIMTQIIDS